MIRSTSILISTLFIFLQACQERNELVNYIKNIDSLTKKVAQLNDEIKIDKQLSPHIQIRNYEAKNSSIILYNPWGLTFHLKTTRPNISESISLIVPAAYTSKDMTIDGFLIEDGKYINMQHNKQLTGVCIITNNKIDITPYNNVNSDSLLSNKNLSAFQQSLLIYNTKIYPCSIFGNSKSKRRAIIQFQDLTCIAESNRALTIFEFQEALNDLGVINAINLDMGSWSEGTYRNHLGQVFKIGEIFSNTNLQTSWLVYSIN